MNSFDVFVIKGFTVGKKECPKQSSLKSHSLWMLPYYTCETGRNVSAVQAAITPEKDTKVVIYVQLAEEPGVARGKKISKKKYLKKIFKKKILKEIFSIFWPIKPPGHP